MTQHTFCIIFRNFILRMRASLITQIFRNTEQSVSVSYITLVVHTKETHKITEQNIFTRFDFYFSCFTSRFRSRKWAESYRVQRPDVPENGQVKSLKRKFYKLNTQALLKLYGTYIFPKNMLQTLQETRVIKNFVLLQASNGEERTHSIKFVMEIKETSKDTTHRLFEKFYFHNPCFTTVSFVSILLPKTTDFAPENELRRYSVDRPRMRFQRKGPRKWTSESLLTFPNLLQYNNKLARKVSYLSRFLWRKPDTNRKIARCCSKRQTDSEEKIHMYPMVHRNTDKDNRHIVC